MYTRPRLVTRFRATTSISKPARSSLFRPSHFHSMTYLQDGIQYHRRITHVWPRPSRDCNGDWVFGWRFKIPSKGVAFQNISFCKKISSSFYSETTFWSLSSCIDLLSPIALIQHVEKAFSRGQCLPLERHRSIHSYSLSSRSSLSLVL